MYITGYSMTKRETTPGYFARASKHDISLALVVAKIDCAILQIPLKLNDHM